MNAILSKLKLLPVIPIVCYCSTFLFPGHTAIKEPKREGKLIR